MASAPQITPYLYTAVTPAGGRRFGVRRATTQRDLASQLRRQSLMLDRAWAMPASLGAAQSMTDKDHVTINTQIGQLLDRGVPLVEALEVVAKTVRAGSRATVELIRSRVSAGSSFADACEQTGEFDRVTVAVYRAAEKTGDLAGAARQLADNQSRQMAIKGKAVTLMIYPMIVLSISVVVALIMLMVVVPMIGDALQEGGIELPGFSKVSIAIGGWMRDNSMLVLGAIGALLILAIIGRKVVLSVAGSFMRLAPGIREVVLAQELARFFSVMAAMTRTGVPLGDALGVANSAISHPTLAKQLEKLRRRLIEGGALRRLLEDVEMFPIATRRLLIAAERSGDLETAFNTLAGDMIEEVDRRSTRLLAALEPALIVLMFVIIGSLLMTIMLPVMNISNLPA